MKNLNADVAIIGGGPAGLASAISAKKTGAKKVLILDRNDWLGGILPQCIHDGFGVEETGKSMTGSEYAEMYISKAKKNNIEFLKETMAIKLNAKKEIIAVNKNGLLKIKAKSIILAMGCREKTRYSIMIQGTRPSGIYTAGVAQAFINLYNIMPGKNVLILGSGDVGLIIARRLKFEGANVLGVVEILPYASGLPRNVVQCLDDYDIPLYLNHTVTNIEGKERIEEVTISQVGDKGPISTTEKKIKCDTLLLSLGLIPENELIKDVNIKIDPLTGGAIVDQNYQTEIKGIYSCGNCLQVYDTVDMLSLDAKLAGKNAAQDKTIGKEKIRVIPNNNVRYVIPQKINKPGEITLSFRVKRPIKNPRAVLRFKDKQILSKKLPFANPANMIRLNVNITEKEIISNEYLEVEVIDE